MLLFLKKFLSVFQLLIIIIIHTHIQQIHNQLVLFFQYFYVFFFGLICFLLASIICLNYLNNISVLKFKMWWLYWICCMQHWLTVRLSEWNILFILFNLMQVYGHKVRGGVCETHSFRNFQNSWWPFAENIWRLFLEIFP